MFSTCGAEGHGQLHVRQMPSSLYYLYGSEETGVIFRKQWALVFSLVSPLYTWGLVLTFTSPALVELKREDDVILILTELTDEAFGLAKLGEKEPIAKMSSTPGTDKKRVTTNSGNSKRDRT